MNIVKENNRVNAYIDGKIVGFVTFPKIEEEVVVINHTMVNPLFRGQGIASKLLEAVVEVIKENNYKCKITCSYAKDWFSKHIEYADILV